MKQPRKFAARVPVDYIQKITPGKITIVSAKINSAICSKWCKESADCRCLLVCVYGCKDTTDPN